MKRVTRRGNGTKRPLPARLLGPEEIERETNAAESKQRTYAR